MRRKSRTTHRLNYVSRSQCSLYPLYRKSRLVSNVLFTPDCSCVFYVYIFLYSFDASDTVYSWPQKISATLYKTLRLGINRCVLSPTLTTNSQRAPVCCFAPLQMPWTCAITLFHSCICSRVSVCESALWFFCTTSINAFTFCSSYEHCFRWRDRRFESLSVLYLMHNTRRRVIRCEEQSMLHATAYLCTHLASWSA